MKITFNVENLRLFHADKDTVNSFIEWTKDTYDCVTKLNTPRGKIHEYIAMILDYTTPGEVQIHMK